MGSKNYGVAGQVKPVGGLDAGIYTAPALKAFVASTLVVCNQHETEADSFWIQIVKSGETPNDAGYIYFNHPLAQRESKQITIGLTLAAGDAILVKSTSGYISFNLFGAELA